MAYNADEVIKGRGKYSRRCKSAVLEADEPESEPKVARMIEKSESYRVLVVQMF